MLEAEDFSTPGNGVAVVEVIEDWDKRMKIFNYDAEKCRTIKLCLSKLQQWMDCRDAKDWTNQLNDKGLVIDCKTSERGFNVLKASKVLPYSAHHVFLTMGDGRYRKSYDVNIEETAFLSKIATNVYTVYQKSKKMFMVVASRDFVLLCYMLRVSTFK